MQKILGPVLFSVIPYESSCFLHYVKVLCPNDFSKKKNFFLASTWATKNGLLSFGPCFNFSPTSRALFFFLTKMCPNMLFIWWHEKEALKNFGKKCFWHLIETKNTQKTSFTPKNPPKPPWAPFFSSPKHANTMGLSCETNIFYPYAA